MVSDKLDSLLQDQIFSRDKPDRERLGNKAGNVLVNTIPAARSDMCPHNLQSGVLSRYHQLS
jgi:hypothetical protein